MKIILFSKGLYRDKASVSCKHCLQDGDEIS